MRYSVFRKQDHKWVPDKDYVDQIHFHQFLTMSKSMSIFITDISHGQFQVFSFAWMSVVNFPFNQFLANVPETREKTRLVTK